MIEWIEREAPGPRPPKPDLAALERAVAAAPHTRQLHIRLGNEHARRYDAARAAAAFAEAERLDPAADLPWQAYAAVLIQLGNAEAALALCDRGLARGAPVSLRHHRGVALRLLGRKAEGNAELERVLASGPGHMDTLKLILRPLAAQADGGPLLDRCEALSPAYRGTAGARAYRAIALSRLGRTEEARALVDLDRHVVRLRFDPPAEFGGIEAFNRILTDEILRDPPPAPKGDGFEINYAPSRSPAFAALSAFTRAAIESTLAQTGPGPAEALPPPPRRGSLGRVTGVLRGDGTNGEHIHARNYLSTVYYVAVPESVRDAGDDRGSLLLGKCTETTRGYQACWGTRHVKPEPGMLTLFPSHFFHDVVPSRTEEPRIVVAGDLRPAPDRA